MKNFGIIGVVVTMFLAITVISGCQESQAQAVESQGKTEALKPAETKAAEPAKAVPEGPAPKIVLTKSTYDFGKIGPSTSHVATFEFKNEGEGPLLISTVKSTCGCSKPALIKGDKRYSIPMKEPVAFKPGESGEVEVTYKSSSVKSTVKKHLYIISDDPKTPQAQLEIEAEVVVKVSVEPEKVDLMLNAENAGMPDLVVKSTDGKEFSIESVFVAQKGINIPFDPTAKASEFTLKPTVDIKQLGQTKTGVIQIKTTHPESGTLLVRYNVRPMYELTNPRYILQNVEPGKPVFRENLIRSNYGKPAEIESWKSRNGYMEIVKQEKEGDHLKITVKITPPEQSSTSRRYITDELTITMKDGNKLNIRCSGWFRLK